MNGLKFHNFDIHQLAAFTHWQMDHFVMFAFCVRPDDKFLQSQHPQHHQIFVLDERPQAIHSGLPNPMKETRLNIIPAASSSILRACHRMQSKHRAVYPG
jgi:hypothetical protein